MRAVVDPNVFISACLSPSGAPRRVVIAWQEGRFEMIVSPLLLTELKRALAYPKLVRRVPADDAADLVGWIERSARVVADPPGPPPMHSPDPGDDYLVTLAASERSALVSGDEHLLSLADELPVFAPRAFLDFLSAGGH